MKKFSFPFEKVLQHKRTLEDVARRDYFEAQAAVDAAKAELNRLYQQIDEARQRAMDLETRGGPQAASLMQIDEFITLQKILIEKQRSKIRELTAIAEQKHEVLVESAKERKILEKLRERRVEEHASQMKLHELKEVDDLVVTRYRMGLGDAGSGSIK